MFVEQQQGSVNPHIQGDCLSFTCVHIFPSVMHDDLVTMLLYRGFALYCLPLSLKSRKSTCHVLAHGMMRRAGGWC